MRMVAISFQPSARTTSGAIESARACFRLLNSTQRVLSRNDAEASENLLIKLTAES
jgi:hypothetical protein